LARRLRSRIELSYLLMCEASLLGCRGLRVSTRPPRLVWGLPENDVPTGEGTLVQLRTRRSHRLRSAPELQLLRIVGRDIFERVEAPIYRLTRRGRREHPKAFSSIQAWKRNYIIIHPAEPLIAITRRAIPAWVNESVLHLHVPDKATREWLSTYGTDTVPTRALRRRRRRTSSASCGCWSRRRGVFPEKLLKASSGSRNGAA